MDQQPITLAAPGLEHVCDLVATVSPIIDAGMLQGLGTAGQRRIIPITGGVVSGRIRGRVLPGGADFQRLPLPADTHAEACADLDARYLLALDGEHAGEHIFVMNRALRRVSQADAAAMARGEAVDPARVYFRCTPQFEVSSPKLRWLTESIFIGAGTRARTGVNISFYRLT
jgi:hypothetical protein